MIWPTWNDYFVWKLLKDNLVPIVHGRKSLSS